MSRIERGPKMSFPRSRLWPARLAWSALSAAAMAFAFAPCQAQSILPTQGVVAPGGAASIQHSGANLSVTQTSQRAIINWDSFSIGQGNGVTFDQPRASSAILNRVTGSTTSTIAGQLQANGQVYLVNPNGIAITPTGSVRVGGGFVASTLGITDDNINNGDLSFTGNGASAAVSNAGSITAAPGGFVGLLGGSVANSGSISVPLGKVGLGSGEQATLNLTGDNFLQVAVPTSTKTADGQALIDVSGKVLAAGGTVQLKAATVARAIRDAVNVPGELSVASASASGGSIILSGGPGGNVSVNGRLDASGSAKGGAIAIGGHDAALRHAKLVASSANGRGGSVTVTGTNAVSLASTSVDASGATGGGAIRIGGDFHGAGDLTSAQTTTIDSASTLNASATASGDGGTVAVWSDATTSFAGQISAIGGASGGNGGYVEVSANPASGDLSYTGLADLTAPKGATGTLLLDPYDITISTGTDFGGSFSGGVYTPTATSVINAITLENQLALSNVVVSTGLSGSPGTDAGNITVLAPITWSSNNGLTLIAANDLAVEAPITSAGGGQLALKAGSFLLIGSALSTSTGAISVTGPTTILAANVTTSAGAITFNNPVQLQSNVIISAGSGSVTFGSTVDTEVESCFPTFACNLTVSAGALSFGGALGGNFALGAVSLTSTASMTLPSITATTIVAQATGAASDLTLAPGTILAASGSGTTVTLGAGRGFINQSGPGAISLIPGARWLIYSANPANDVFGGLDSGNMAIWNTPFGGAVPAAGNYYAFAFQPAITITSGDLAKSYGQDVTSLVAADYTISGLQPGVAGAFLPDSAAAVYSGTPQVTSLGSPARASVAGSPYAITVAPGSFAVSDNYALILDSAGRLTIDPLPLTYAVADANSIYGATPVLGAATLSGVLPGDSVSATVGAFSGMTQIALGPRTPVGVYSERVTALSSPDYFVAPSGNTPGTLTIDPRALTYAVANASSVFGTMPILGAATLFGVVPGDVVIPTVGAFLGATPVALSPLTPQGVYAELVTAISNPNYRLAPAPNFPGILVISSGSDPGFLPGLTQINNPAGGGYDLGAFGELLQDFSSCEEPPSLPDPNRYSDPDAALRAISQALDNYFKRCENPTQATIADALDEYAAKLQVLAPRLPPALRNIPAIVAEAARRVRAARSRTEAVAVLRQTIAAIHKEIALVRSEDPETHSREIRDGEAVVGAVNVASVALVNSGGL